ncbi:VOC family protein [Bacillus mojavensis]|uniref:VOC family protein n=1 Tax=Bacillus mojavensis TaxID=72360 RepID=UPI002DBAE281|nr:VOC family protein [Bacillus mojavensis]MEC1671681.1 VOC family protein [Bacillus mojavensis]
MVKIKNLEIFVSNFHETVSFYKDTLQFKRLLLTDTLATFQVGESILTLHQDKANRYSYHFAFNIHSNIFAEAKEWLKKRVDLLEEDGDDEVYFSNAKARSAYFEDPAGNIVEFISRLETSPETTSKEFTPDNVIGISEIGLSTNHVKECFDYLLKLGIRQRNDEPFSKSHLQFMGEYEEGVYILLGPVGRRWIFSDKYSIDAPLMIETDRGIIKNFD